MSVIHRKKRNDRYKEQHKRVLQWLIFRGYPNQKKVIDLENKLNITTFVDLTSTYERLTTPYKTTKKYIHFYIKDHDVPKNIIGYTSLLYNILGLIKKNEKIYVHCKGGHGRSGIVVACLLKILLSISAENAILMTTRIHNERKDMKEVWKRLGSPQTSYQRKFVHNYFKPYYINQNNCLHINHVQTFKIPKFDYFISVHHAKKYFLQIIDDTKMKRIFEFNLTKIACT